MIVRMKRIPGLIISLMVSFAMMVSLLSGIVIMPGVEARAEEGDPAENVEVFISDKSDVGYNAAKAAGAEVENYSVIEENAIHSKPKNKSFSFYVHYYSAAGYSINDIKLNAEYKWDDSAKEYTESEQIFAYSESNNTQTKKTIEEVDITASKVKSVSDGNLESVNGEQGKNVTHLYQEITVNQTAELWMDLKCDISCSDGNIQSSEQKIEEDKFIVSLDVKKSMAGDPLLVAKDINDLNKKIANHDKTVGEELYQSPGNADGKGFVYLGKAYYYTSEVMYPDVTYEEVLAQNNGTYDKHGWTTRGIYDSEGFPIGSHIFFQYYLVDKYGNMRTDDDAEGSYPVSYLVYDEFPEDKTKGKDVAEAFTDAFNEGGQFHGKDWMKPISGYVNSCEWTDIQGDGTEVLCPNESHANVSRIFGSAEKRMNFYNIWGVHGSITVYGDVIGCMALDREKYAGMYYSEDDKAALEKGEEPKYDSVYGNDPGATRWYIYKEEGDYEGKGEEEILLRDENHDLFENMYENKSNTYDRYRGDDESYLYDNLSSEDRNTIKSHQRYSDEIIQDSRLPFSESSVKNSTVVINGDVGFIDLHDSWEGECTIGNGYSFGGLALYDTSEQLFKMNNMVPKQYYSTVVGDGTAIISGGKIAKPGIQPLKDGQSIEGNMYGIDVDNPDIDKFNSYTSIQGETFGEKDTVPATSSGISGYGENGQGETGSITIGVSGLEGNGNTINPMVRKKKDKVDNNNSWQNGNAWWKAIVQALNAPKDTEVAMMDIALVEKRDENEKDRLVEPGDPVDLYFDFDLSTDYWEKLGNDVVLYHVKDNGQIEKLPISKTTWDGGKVSIVKAQTGSFSTFFFAENMKVPSAINQDLAKLAKAQHDADVPIQLPSNGGNSGNGGNPGGGGGGYSGGGNSGSGSGGGDSSGTPTGEETPTPTATPGGSVTPGGSGTGETKPEPSKTVTTDEKGNKITTTVITDDEGNKTTTTVTEKTDGSKVTKDVTTRTDGTEVIKSVETTPAGKTIVAEQTTEADGTYNKVTTTTETKVNSSGEVIGEKTSIVIEKKTDASVTTSTYEVTDNAKNTVSVTGIETTSKSGTLTIPQKITADGTTYTVTVIKPEAFKNNKKTKTLDTGESIKDIGKAAFQNNTSLTKVTLGRSTKTIGANVFRGDKNLKKITINTGKITKVGKNAFKGISKNAKIYIEADKKEYKKVVKLIKKSGGLPKKVKFKRL
ncbi:MAG: leucine-rich repeat protein [Eubacterium sp.]|nr:leucine-rich repeat protein [Eubacterium sp.]